MEHSDKQRITLRIDYHKVVLNVPREQEPAYRDAALHIDNLYKRYAKAYPQLPIEKIWLYVALEAAVDLQIDQRGKDLKPIQDLVRQLNRKVLDTTEQIENKIKR